MPRIGTVIIGGGISGASALHWCAVRGDNALLLERGSALGGVIGSRLNDLGALVETGPNSTQLNNPRLRELIDDLGLGDRVVEANSAAANRYILRNGRLVSLPSGPGSFLRTPLFSFPAKLRLLREPFIPAPPAQVEESVAGFVERRLGREFLDYAINPFVSGVYAGRPEDLSLRHAFPRLHTLETEYGSLIKGAIKGKKKRAEAEKKGDVARDRARLISFLEGMAELPNAIGRRWKDRIRTGMEVQGIEREGGFWRVRAGEEWYEADRLVIATDAETAAGLIEPIDPALATALRRIEYPPVASAVSLYDRSAVTHPLDGFGVLVPERERRNVLGVIFSSTLFPGRAPDGMVALTTFIGGARQPAMALRSPEEIERDLYREHQELLGATAPPRSFDLMVWKRAIPQYNLGYSLILDEIARAEREHPELHLLGNYRGGVSVGDCVKSAWELAPRLR